MKLCDCLLQFFDEYLTNIKGVSEHTIRAYRDTFSLFLPFAAQRSGCKIKELQVEQLTVQLILEFLDHLEKERHNKPVTRNLRLAAFKSMAKMLRLVNPEQRLLAERLLRIPQKRAQKPLIGYLSHEEILKVLAKVDLRLNEGFRDYTILHLLFDSGARASEITSLNLDSFDGDKKTLAILGKGSRYRLIELWCPSQKLETDRNYGLLAQDFEELNSKRMQLSKNYSISNYLWRCLGSISGKRAAKRRTNRMFLVSQRKTEAARTG